MNEVADLVAEVVRAARACACEDVPIPLYDAVRALEDALATPVPPRTWGEVLAGDEVRDKEGTWHTVTEVRNGTYVIGPHRVTRQPSAPGTFRRTVASEEAAIKALTEAFGSISILRST